MKTGQKIKRLRTEKGLSQKDLGVLIGVSQGRITFLESDKCELKLASLRRISKALGCELNYFIEGETEQWFDSELKKYENDPEFIKEIKLIEEGEKQ